MTGKRKATLPTRAKVRKVDDTANPSSRDKGKQPMRDSDSDHEPVTKRNKTVVTKPSKTVVTKPSRTPAYPVTMRTSPPLVAQQRPEMASNRFRENAALKDVFGGKYVLGEGVSGIAVTILQQALSDAGFGVPVSGQFDEKTQEAVRKFQAENLTDTEPSGIVNEQTMHLLDEYFRRDPGWKIAADPERALAEGTRKLSEIEKDGLRRAITTEQRTASGEEPEFRQIITTNESPYEIRIRNTLNARIDEQYKKFVTSRPARIPKNLIDGGEINRVAGKAKAVTDIVFGRYQAGPQLAFGVNILDEFVERSNKITTSPEIAERLARWRINKLLSGDRKIKEIDREHGAVQRRDAEAKLIAPIRTEILEKRRDQLLEIHCNWPASSENGNIHLQRYRGTTPKANREILYALFATAIHEYIHTLENPQHVNFRKSLTEQGGGFVLREGMTDYFAKMVWDHLTFDAELRKDIEGTSHDPTNPTAHQIREPTRYNEWRNAERAVGIIGVRNAMAAFFLGQTDLIKMD